MIQASMIPPKPTDPQLAAKWAADVVADPSAVVIDTETTGLGPDAEICDIAIVALDGTVLLNMLVRPYRPIPAAAAAVHGIGDDDVYDSPAWAEVAPVVKAILYGRRVCAWNAAFDLSIVNQVNRADDIPEFAAGWECAMLAYGALRGERSRFGQGYRWLKLGEAAVQMGITPGTHRALADTETTRQIIVAMAGMAAT